MAGRRYRRNWKNTLYHQTHPLWQVRLTPTERERVEKQIKRSGLDPKDFLLAVVAEREGQRLPESQGGVQTRFDAEQAEMLERACIVQAETLLRTANARFKRNGDPEERRRLREEAGVWQDLAGKCSHIIDEHRRRLALQEQGIIKPRIRRKDQGELTGEANDDRQASNEPHNDRTDR